MCKCIKDDKGSKSLVLNTNESVNRSRPLVVGSRQGGKVYSPNDPILKQVSGSAKPGMIFNNSQPHSNDYYVVYHAGGCTVTGHNPDGNWQVCDGVPYWNVLGQLEGCRVGPSCPHLD